MYPPLQVLLGRPAGRSRNPPALHAPGPSASCARPSHPFLGCTVGMILLNSNVKKKCYFAGNQYFRSRKTLFWNCSLLDITGIPSTSTGFLLYSPAFSSVSSQRMQPGRDQPGSGEVGKTERFTELRQNVTESASRTSSHITSAVFLRLICAFSCLGFSF